MALVTVSSNDPPVGGTFDGASTVPPNLVPLVEIYPRCLSDCEPVHADWIFGAIAEFVDNAKDAKASKMFITFKDHSSEETGQEGPYSLSITDNGTGMSHEELLGLLTFGCNTSGTKDPKQLGMFGMGFQNGCMALGTDALVITSSKTTISVALLSRSFNRANENLEVLIATYIKGFTHQPDLKVQSKESAKRCLDTIISHSPFCELAIGEEMGGFKDCTGTSIFIWDPEEVDSESALECADNDILIRSRRVRTRQGVCGNEVPMDYSLRAYLELFFINSSMEVYLMGSLVKWNVWEQKLSLKKYANSTIKNTSVALTLGISEDEKARRNRGMFIYWRGRLIMAYKRVGHLIHSVSKCYGIIGVVNLTSNEDADEDKSWLKLTKQEFRDSEAYDLLKKWLGTETNTYWDNYVDPIEVNDGPFDPKTQEEAVQCSRCLKWRKLSAPIIPTGPFWFCEREPYFGKCDDPQEKVADGVVTIAIQRSVDSGQATNLLL